MSRENGGCHAVEAHPGAVRRGREDLGAVAPVDFDRVDAVAPLVEIAAIIRIPDDQVGAAFTKFTEGRVRDVGARALDRHCAAIDEQIANRVVARVTVRISSTAVPITAADISRRMGTPS